MNLTVDASIAVKWFVAEPLCEEARLLLTPRIRLHAPELLLAEFANTIWKKVRRGEIPDPRPYFDELVSLHEIITLHPSGPLIGRAAEIAVEIDHPVYDCLYLACVEATESAVVTADRRFADKAAKRLPNVDVLHIGAPDVAGRIEAATTALVIGQDKVEELTTAYDVFAETEQSVLDRLHRGHEGLKITTGEDRELFLNSPSCRRLVNLIHKLTDEERVDLLALGWFGSGSIANWKQALEHAERMTGSVGDEYVAGYGRHWRTGYVRLTGG